MNWKPVTRRAGYIPATQPIRPHEVAISSTERLRNRHAVLVHEVRRVEEELVKRECIADPLTIKKED